MKGMNWEEAEQYLKDIEQRYAEIGSAGYLALIMVIRPLRDRFNKGERSEELFEEIMELD
jgi:hypothetical protein